MKRNRKTFQLFRDIKRQTRNRRTHRYVSSCVGAIAAISLLLTIQYRTLSQEANAASKVDTFRQPSARSLAEEFQDPEDAPQVALMFLSRGVLPLERMWFEFFRTAAEIEPVRWNIPEAKPAAEPKEQLITHKRSLRCTEASRKPALSSARSSAEDGSSSASSADAQHDGLFHPSRQKLQDVQSGSEVSLLNKRRLHGGALELLSMQGDVHRSLPKQQEQVLASAGDPASASSGAVLPQATSAAMEKPMSASQSSSRPADLLLGSSFVATAGSDGSRISHDDSVRSRLSPLNPGGVIARQQLFSVYIHTAPGFEFRPSSIFSGYQIPDRVQVRWGQYTAAEAERRLIMAALKNLRNQRLILLSESCAPLYPPQLIYTQLLGEPRSRVNVCSQPELLDERWNPAMYRPGLLKPFHWRKSSQWKSLTREHAELVAEDTTIWPVFRRECYTYFLSDNVEMPPHLVPLNKTSPIPKRNCVSDEHYVPTLLAVHGRDDETACVPGSPTHTEWVEGGWSPKVHNRREISRPFLAQLRQQGRGPGECDVEAAVESTYGLFRRKGQATTLSGGVSEYRPLEDHCLLFARKFSPDTAPWLVVLGRDCVEGTAISAECLPQ